MSQSLSPPISPLRAALRHELDEVRSNWTLFLGLGLATIVLGTLLIALPLIGTFAAVWMLGALLFASGVLEFVAAFAACRWSGVVLGLLAGSLYMAVGLLTFFHTGEAAAALTLLLAAFFIVGGLFRIAAAATLRFTNWIWPLAGGVLSLVLGLLIWAQWPASSLWVIGLFVGIEVLFTGWTWVVIALALRRLPKFDAAPASP